jgi:hypothetical protein
VYNSRFFNVFSKKGTGRLHTRSKELAGAKIAFEVIDGRCGMPSPGGALNYVRPTTTVFELEALEGLPCGCVAAAYRARPWDVAVVSLEAKGPHCILAGHSSGQILRLGDPAEFDDDQDSEE